jgi:gliding motility-associated lipoprotein GldH
MIVVLLCLMACDPSRVYENSFDFNDRYWLREVVPAFEFQVPQDGQYNLYMNLRNEASYGTANVYFRYYLTDSTGLQLQSAQKSEFLFHPKTGKPYGSTTLGDIFDHQVLLLEGYDLQKGGKYTLRFEQFMRTDTLRGVLSIGARVEHAARKNH